MQVGQAGGAEGAGGVILQGLIATILHILKGRCGNPGFELLPSGDVHAPLGDPGCLEAARGTNVEVGVELTEKGLEVFPAGLGRVERREEESGAAEVIGLNETEGLAGVLADGGGVEGGRGAAADDGEDGEVEGARGGEKGVVCREGRKGEGEKDEKEEEEGHWRGGFRVVRVSWKGETPRRKMNLNINMNTRQRVDLTYLGGEGR